MLLYLHIVILDCINALTGEEDTPVETVYKAVEENTDHTDHDETSLASTTLPVL